MHSLRPSHPYYAGTEHVRFSPTRQTSRSPSAKRREVLGELKVHLNLVTGINSNLVRANGRDELPRLVRTFLLMDVSFQ